MGSGLLRHEPHPPVTVARRYCTGSSNKTGLFTSWGRHQVGEKRDGLDERDGRIQGSNGALPFRIAPSGNAGRDDTHNGLGARETADKGTHYGSSRTNIPLPPE